MQAPPPVPELLQQLASMAANVNSLSSIEGIDWSRQPADDEWSLTEILCHLRDVEREVHQTRFKSLIEEESAFLPGVSADEWANERGYCFENGQKALESYLAARRETLSMLAPLDAQMWQRQGRHAFFGDTTMHELLFLVVRHDEIHWQQIQALLSMKDDA